VVLCNAAQANAGELARQVADLYLQDELQAPSSPIMTPRESAEGAVEASRSARYKGLYWDPEGNAIRRIDDRGGVLRFVREEDDESELLTVSQDHFRTKDGEVDVVFRETEDAVHEMVVTASGGKARVFHAVEPWSPSPDELSALTGSYRCPNLEMTYRVVASGNRLELVGRNGSTHLLVPLFAGAFRSDLTGVIRFTSSGHCQVSAFEVTSGRTKLCFFRQSPKLAAP
jgi:hypothetical protein